MSGCFGTQSSAVQTRGECLFPSRWDGFVFCFVLFFMSLFAESGHIQILNVILLGILVNFLLFVFTSPGHTALQRIAH